jgi:eukaryotic-like serine/threonine-protein kinase
MSKASSTIAISFATSLITSSIIFIGLQFFLVPKLKKEPKKKVDVTVEVPKVIGILPEDAKGRLKLKGLLLSVSNKSPHAKIAKGLIHTQQPFAGSVLKKGSTVTVIISSGIPKVKIPLVVGKIFTTENAALLKLGFKVSATYREDSTAKPGQILSQNPAPGKEVSPGSSISMVVAKASSMVELPKWKGKVMNKKKLKKEVEALGLVLGKVRYRDSSDVRNNYIYKMNPKGGEKVKPGSKVDFTLHYTED